MGANSDLTQGYRTNNVGPTESKLLRHNSARPGDPQFGHNFSRMDDTFARATTGHELLRDRQATPSGGGSSLRGNVGKPIDTRVDEFVNASIADIQAKVEDEQTQPTQ